MSRTSYVADFLQIRTVVALNPIDGSYIPPSQIPITTTNGLLQWYSTVNFLSTIYMPSSLSTSILDVLQAVQPGLSTLSTVICSTIQSQLVSTVGGLSNSGYATTADIDNRTTLLSQEYGYISSTTLYDIITHLGDLSWIMAYGGPMPFCKNQTGPFPALTGGYISTLSNIPMVSSLAGVFSSIGVNCNSPKYLLDVNGLINARAGVFSNATFLTSDSNVKENIVDADLGVCYNNVRNLPLRRFTYISSIAGGKIDKTQIGFIAQEAGEVFPKSIMPIYEESVGSTIQLLNYDQIFLSHYGATQLLMSTVDSQAARISSLEGVLAAILAKF